jgi:hypothetical protein
MDQSFSPENFQKIFSYENRKGRNLEKEFFSDVFDTTLSITEINKKIHKKNRHPISKESLDEIKKLKEEKAASEKKKQELIKVGLDNISKRISERQFRILIREVKTLEKPIYIVKETVENFFAIKQLQYNLRKSFKVRQGNRIAIINQVNSLVKDNFPKVILRTDIKSFYESIPHDKLLAKINSNPALSFLSKKLIWNILKEFISASRIASKVGIPRGVGISAYLAEIYMKDVDKEISSLPDVTYYARYVDDIIIVFTPKSIPAPNQKVPSYKDEVKKILENNTGLEMNPLKTVELDLIKSNQKCQFSFLGYQFLFENLKFAQNKLSDTKLLKYKSRITLAIQRFKSDSRVDPRAARRLLIHSLNFLTGNTRLLNNKSNVLVGVYYTNSLLTEPLEDLVELDNFLLSEIEANIANENLQSRLRLFSFKKGFEDRKYVNFNSKLKRIELKQVLKTLIVSV